MSDAGQEERRFRPYRRPKCQVPINKEGGLCFYQGYVPQGTVWHQPSEFNAVLKFGYFNRGRSGGTACWYDAFSPARMFPMFLVDFEKLLHRCELQSGNVVDGLWGYVKRGANYGITPVLPEEELT